MKKIFIALILLGFLQACKDDATQPRTDRPSEAYARWKSYGYHDYTFDQMHMCFCINGGETMKVTVRADTVQSVLRLSDTTLLGWSESRQYLTIDSLFAIIRDKRYDSLVIRYQPVFGYPDTLDIDPQMHPIDGGVLIISSNLRVP
jgi:hypothetical protein